MLEKTLTMNYARFSFLFDITKLNWGGRTALKTTQSCVLKETRRNVSRAKVRFLTANGQHVKIYTSMNDGHTLKSWHIMLLLWLHFKVNILFVKFNINSIYRYILE